MLFRHVSKMSQNPDSNDRYVEALDFIITFMRDHERRLDKLNNKLGNVVDGLGGFTGLSKKLDNLNKEIDRLEMDVARLAAIFRNRERQNSSAYK
jgi:archaellum component FlaC